MTFEIPNDPLIYLGVDERFYSVTMTDYPDGMPLLDRPKVCPKVILFRPMNLQQFMAGLFWMDALVERGYDCPPLVLPFMPGARQDRLNSEGDYLFTVKSVAREINARKFPRVVLLDPHSNVAPALVDRSNAVSIPTHFLGNLVLHQFYKGVIAPDSGAHTRAFAMARALGVPLFEASKVRDLKTGRIRQFHLHAVLESGRYLVVDDICDGGATFEMLFNALPIGIVVDLFVSHGLFSKGTDALLKNYKQIFCTDSVISRKDRVNVLPICRRMVDYLVNRAD